MSEPPAVDLVPAPTAGRTFRAGRAVRFGDVDRAGRLRLDALATYLQDVAGDDTADTGTRDVGAWVMRRNVFEVLRPPAYGQHLTLETWASGAGSRWAERRLSVRGGSAGGAGDDGADAARVEGVSLWVYVDPVTLRPVPLAAGFDAVYGPATGGRRVSSRFQHAGAAEPPAPIERWRWAVRATDIDPLGHVNNAATWAIVEEALAARPVPAPLRAEVEHRVPIEPDADVVVEVQATGPASQLWVREAATGSLLATARVAPLAG